MHFLILEGHFSQRFLAEGRRDTQRVLVLIPKTQKMFPILISPKMFPILIPPKMFPILIPILFAILIQTIPFKIY